MERRISKKVNDYIHIFKNEIAEKVKAMDSSDPTEIMNFIYQYKNFELSKEDFMKRKRVKIWFLYMKDVVQKERMDNNVQDERRMIYNIVELIVRELLTE